VTEKDDPVRAVLAGPPAEESVDRNRSDHVGDLCHLEAACGPIPVVEGRTCQIELVGDILQAGFPIALWLNSFSAWPRICCSRVSTARAITGHVLQSLRINRKGITTGYGIRYTIMCAPDVNSTDSSVR
jgi:hypothetical protein